MNRENGQIAGYLSSLIVKQIEILEKFSKVDSELPLMVIAQLFDTVDWIRMHLAIQEIDVIKNLVCKALPVAFPKLVHFDEIERYVEEMVFAHSEHARIKSNVNTGWFRA